MVSILRALAILLNVIMSGILVYFTSSLHWSSKSDRPSIVYFLLMIALFALNTALVSGK